MSDKLDILKKYWGYASFRPLQEEIIDNVMSGLDVLALMPTGGGKSMTFQVPGMMMEGVCLVVSPLIALIKDQVQQLRQRNINAAYILSGMDYREMDRIMDNCIYGDIKFLYVSPERLKTELFIERFKQMNISFIAVDEAHCISQWGYDFRPAYLEIAEIRQFQPKVGILALTASATPEVVEDIQEKLLFLQKNLLQRSFFRENLHYLVIKEDNKHERLLRGLNALSGSAIIYVRSRRLTREISQWLNKYGISAAPYHAGLLPELKDQTQQAWLDEKVRVIVATNAFGMGIDKANVRLVIHFDLPDSIEAYFQEAGRAGRDGLRAHAVLLYADADIRQLIERVGWGFPPIDTIKNVYFALGNYCQLAFGAGLNETFTFNIGDFSQRSDLKLFDIYSSIKILEREGYIQFSESLNQHSKIRLIVNQKELYFFEVANAKFEPILKVLLRTYSGLFDDFKKINEYLLAKRLHLPVEQIITQLKYLDSVGLTEYIPANNNPQIIWLTERLPLSHLHISYEQYGLLKERQEKRVKTFIKYLKTPVCRNRQLLGYFGESITDNCGKCDVCLQKLRAKRPIEIEKAMIDVLKKKNVSLQAILSAIPRINEAEALEILRFLADEGQVIKNDQNQWSWSQ